MMTPGQVLLARVVASQRIDSVAFSASSSSAVFAFPKNVFGSVLMPLRAVSHILVAVPSGWSVGASKLPLFPLRRTVSVGSVSHTGTAVTATVSASKGIFFIVRVAIDALRAARVDGGRSVAARVVYGMGDSFQVPRVNASAFPAQVVNGELWGNLADENRVGVPVREHAALSDAEKLVSLHAADVDLEKPAGGSVAAIDHRDELPEPLGQTRVSEHCGTIVHIDSTQSVMPRGVSAPAGPLPVIIAAGGGGDD